MQFKIYDILSSLIPGTVVASLLIWMYQNNLTLEHSLSQIKDFSGIATTIFLTSSYLIGYLIHALGSWIEPILWFSWGGRPSEILLKKKSKRINMVFSDEILNSLLKKLNRQISLDSLNSKDFKELFQVAKNTAFSNNISGKIEERLSEFNNSYIFSRNILISWMFVLIVLTRAMFVNSLSWIWLLIALFVSLLLWYRCRDKAIYYSREILTTAYNNIQK